MSLQTHGFCSVALLGFLATVLSAQTPAGQAPAGQAPTGQAPARQAPAGQPPSGQAPAPAPSPAPQPPNFISRIDLVTTDVLVRDEKGGFIPDLRKDDFEVYEDGVLQDISSMTVVTGGRVTNALLPPPPPPPEGILLPPSRPRTDTSGRIFVFFVDDQHLSFHNTGRVRELFSKMAKELVHDGDLFGIVSSGPSSIQVQMTYDKTRLQDAIKKMTGNELTPDDIINGTSGPGGPSEIRYRARVAFSTVEETLNNLEQVHNRRKALVYVSDGYDFIPFQAARLGLMDPSSPFAQNTMAQTQNALASQQAQQCGGTAPNPTGSANTIQATQQEEFADADLARELWELTRTANRANVTIYTIDPRGLVGPLSDVDDNVDPQQWGDFIRKSQDSLRVLAEETGGVAIVNMNDFSKGIRRIDAETGDYYVLGFYSKNPDPLRKNRRLEVKVRRPGVQLIFRKEYSIKPPPAPVSSTKK
jgi:VWFA-related protein